MTKRMDLSVFMGSAYFLAFSQYSAADFSFPKLVSLLAFINL